MSELDNKTITKLRKELVALKTIDIKNTNILTVKEKFDNLATNFIDLNVSSKLRKKIIKSLNTASTYFNLLNEEDFGNQKDNLINRNEVLSVLSKVSTELNTILVEQQKELGFQ